MASRAYLIAIVFDCDTFAYAARQYYIDLVRSTMDEVRALQTVMMEFDMPAQQQRLFQAWLQAEDGLALVRCVDGVQQLWTTAVQVDEVLLWLKSLPESLGVVVLRQYVWGDVLPSALPDNLKEGAN